MRSKKFSRADSKISAEKVRHIATPGQNETSFNAFVPTFTTKLEFQECPKSF